jgi:NAD(P)-dependent dehydrogenase (short-subunit alcohol dehydrogenase family)
MGRLVGKVALITGASSGIGRACAERFATEGAMVVAADVQTTPGVDLVRGIRAAGGQAEYTDLDVTREEAWIKAISDVRTSFGRLDVLVNSAGIALSCPTWEMELADFRRQMAVNVEGVFLGCKHAIPVMREGTSGSIINLSSTAGLRGSPKMAGYSASKGAVRLFTKALAAECGAARDGIRVNSVHPGLIDTPLWHGFTHSGLDAISEKFVPLGVKGHPDDIANCVLWLACDESRYATGAEFVIDGGMTAR